MSAAPEFMSVSVCVCIRERVVGYSHYTSAQPNVEIVTAVYAKGEWIYINEGFVEGRPKETNETDKMHFGYSKNQNLVVVVVSVVVKVEETIKSCYRRPSSWLWQKKTISLQAKNIIINKKREVLIDEAKGDANVRNVSWPKALVHRQG